MDHLTFGTLRFDFIEFVEFEVGKKVYCRSMNGWI